MARKGYGEAVDPPDVDVDVDLDALRAQRDTAKVEFERLQGLVTAEEERLAAVALAEQFDPSQFVGVDASGNGTYSIMALHAHEGNPGLVEDWPVDKPYNERYLPVGGLMFEHVATVNGVWGYRFQE